MGEINKARYVSGASDGFAESYERIFGTKCPECKKVSKEAICECGYDKNEDKKE